jgi:tight adherence protein B
MIPTAAHRTRARLAASAEGAGFTRSSRGPTFALGAAGLAAIALTAGPKAAVAFTAAAAAVLVYQHTHARASVRRQRANQLPPALETLATSLRTGASLPVALQETGATVDPPLGKELTAVARAAAHGRPITEVLDQWSAHHDDPGTRLAATALVLATVVGSTPAHAVDSVAATLRERLDLAAERRALGTQARASALVLALAPAAFATLLVMGDTPAAHFLLRSPAGWTCLVIGLAFDAAGAWWMSRLTRGPQP